MLDVVSSEVQREIADRVGGEVSLRLRIAAFAGAGRFKRGTRYKVLESAGFAVMLSADVAQDDDGALRISGHVNLMVKP